MISRINGIMRAFVFLVGAFVSLMLYTPYANAIQEASTGFGWPLPYTNRNTSTNGETCTDGWCNNGGNYFSFHDEVTYRSPVYHPGEDWNVPGISGALWAEGGKSCDKDKGLDVVAVANGEVVYSDASSWGGIVIKHLYKGETWYSQYGHITGAIKIKGNSVKKGEKIAQLSDTQTPCAHLHFEIRTSKHPNPEHGPYFPYGSTGLNNLANVNSWYKDPDEFIPSHPAYTPSAAGVDIVGQVIFGATPLCALILANGQHMFSCSGDGSYNLTVPLDANGTITLFSFASGFAPFKQVLTAGEAAVYQANMVRSDIPRELDVSKFVTQISRPGWANLSGTVINNGESVCAMVLANGQNMFTCGKNLGKFNFEVPLDKEGNITLFGFASGFSPFKEIIPVDILSVTFSDGLDLYEQVSANFAGFQSDQLELKAPDFAEYGATVPVSVNNIAAGKGHYWLFHDINDVVTPLATFNYIDDRIASYFISTRIKMNATGDVIVIYKNTADGTIKANRKHVNVITSGASPEPCNGCAITKFHNSSVNIRARYGEFKMIVAGHPMYSTDYIDEVLVSADNKPMVWGMLSPWLSKNPYLHVNFNPAAQEVEIELETNTGRTFKKVISVRP